MAQNEQLDRSAAAQQELEGARLGDARLERRLGQIVGSLAQRASASLPAVMGDDAALEATYRFLNNERVSAAAILEPHVQRTLQRCNRQQRVLAVFDTTELRFGGEREQLGHLQHGGRGMFAHVGLAVSGDGTREPLGTLHLETVLRSAEKKNRKTMAGAPDNERLRWHRAVQAVYKTSPDAICVMDREADVFELAFEMASRNQFFVVRAAQNRSTQDGLLWDLLDEMPCLSTRQVELAARAQHKRKSKRETLPARSAHTATLELMARAVVVHPPSHIRTLKTPSLALHLVQVIERDPPQGDEPVQWILLTNLPIGCARQVDFIVDSYCARWVIEEFFKVLKSGCAIEKRQLESVASVTNILAVSLPVAWLILRLRNLSRDEPDRRAGTLLSPLMLHCLRTLYLKQNRKILPNDPSCKEVAWAIAALGGHIKNNGEPGSIVLGRGLDRLLEAAEIASALGVRCDQS